MKKFLSLIRNKWRQYSNRMFLSDTDNHHIWYKQLILGLLNLDAILDKKIGKDKPSIILVSDNLLIKVLFFMYSLITNADLVLISPKFSITTITNAITSRRPINVLIMDKNVEVKIYAIEQEEGISIFKYFKYVDTTSSIMEKLLPDGRYADEEDESRLNVLYHKGLRNLKDDKHATPKLTVLSPGTTNEPCFINVPYEILLKSMQMMSYFMDLKVGDEVTVIADFEFFPNVFTILGFLNGLHFVQPVEDIQSAEHFVDQFKNCNTKPSVVIITSQKFRLMWDSILLKVYSNSLLFKLSKYSIVSWIPTLFVLREIRKTFGRNVEKVHILNEELGAYCLGILKRSKIFFTSSYGYLEQGNFLAFKDPTLFRSKNYCYKPGGSVLKESNELFQSVKVVENALLDQKINGNYVGEVIVETSVEGHIRAMKSEDLAMEIPNIGSQGDRKYIYVVGRKRRNPATVSDVNLDLAEKTIKDTLLIRDCFMVKSTDGYRLYVEPREEVFDIHHIDYDELTKVVNLLKKDLKDNKSINISGHATLRFNGFRNIAGKLQYHTMW